MRRLTLAAASLLLAGAACAAIAAPPTQPPSPPRLFLSPSGEPFHATPQAPDPLQTWFDAADTGHLGYLDRAEFRADAARFFKRLDENGDGTVDGFEVADYEHKVVPELADWSEGIPVSDTGGHDHLLGGPHDHGHGDAGHRDGDHAQGRHGPAIAQLIRDPEPVMAADFDFDSHITLDEWMRVTDARFDALDEDKSGKLTLAELRARLAQSEHGGGRADRRPELRPNASGRRPGASV